MVKIDLEIAKKEGTMTPYEQELLEKYLAYLNVIGEEGAYPSFEAWYQEVRYAQGPGALRTLEEASELRYKDVLEAARVFNRLQESPVPPDPQGCAQSVRP